MKLYFKKSTMDGTGKLKSHIHGRAFSAIARLRTAVLALACVAIVGNSFAAKPGAPTAQNASITLGANFDNPIVLKGTDPNGDPLTFTVVSSPSRGTLSGSAPNLIYRPFVNFLGADSFTFTVSDGRFTSAPARVFITVKAGLLIENISITEGNSGEKTVNFPVTVTAGPVTNASFRYSTIDGTAKAGSDYVAASGGFIGFSGAGTGFIGVHVKGDTAIEQNETFLVQLFDVSSNLVVLNGTGRCTIINDDGTTRTEIGTATLTPENPVVQVGEPVKLSLDWTHPVGWRQLNSIDLLLVDDEGESLVVRWDEAPNNFSLFNPAADRFLQAAAAGSPTRLDSSAATLHLQESTGEGPPGQTVTIDYGLSFKPQAAGRTFSIEAFATDDEGNQQGFESVGTITVLPR